MPLNRVVNNALKHKRDFHLLDAEGLVKTIIEEPSFKTLPRHNQNVFISMAKTLKALKNNEFFKAGFLSKHFISQKQDLKETPSNPNISKADGDDPINPTNPNTTKTDGDELNTNSTTKGQEDNLPPPRDDDPTNPTNPKAEGDDPTNPSTPKADGDELDTNSTTKGQEDSLPPLKEFGTNYAEFKGKPKEGLQKLIDEKEGQVQGLWHREDIGDIDLPYGKVINPDKHTGYGLAHILDKHEGEFARFGEGETGVINGLNKVIKEGIVVDVDTQRGLKDIWLKDGEDYFKVRLRKSFDNKETNHWVATAFHHVNDNVPEVVSGAKQSFHTGERLTGSQNLSPTTPNNNAKDSPTSQDINTKEQPKTLEDIKVYDKALSDMNNALEFSKDVLIGYLKSLKFTLEGKGSPSDLIQRLEGLPKTLDLQTLVANKDAINEIYLQALKVSSAKKDIHNSLKALDLETKNNAIFKDNFDKLEFIKTQSEQGSKQSSKVTSEDKKINEDKDFKEVSSVKGLDVETSNDLFAPKPKSEPTTKANSPKEVTYLSSLENEVNIDTSPIKDLNLPTFNKKANIEYAKASNKDEFNESIYKVPSQEVLELNKALNGDFTPKNPNYLAYSLIGELEKFMNSNLPNKNLAKFIEDRTLKGYISPSMKDLLLKHIKDNSLDIKSLAKDFAVLEENYLLNKAINKALNLEESFHKASDIGTNSFNVNGKDYKATFKLIEKDDLKPNFTNSKTQYRLEDNKVAKANLANFNANTHLNISNQTLEDGVPLLDKLGNIISGNHRSQKLLGLTPLEKKSYEEALAKFLGDKKDLLKNYSNPILIRVLDSDDKGVIKELSLLSNLGRTNSISDKMPLLTSILGDDLKTLASKHTNALDTEDLKESLKLKFYDINKDDVELALLDSTNPSFPIFLKDVLKADDASSLSEIKSLKEASLELFNLKNTLEDNNLLRQGDLIDLLPQALRVSLQDKKPMSIKEASEFLDSFISGNALYKDSDTDLELVLMSEILKGLKNKDANGGNTFKEFIKDYEKEYVQDLKNILGLGSGSNLFSEGDLLRQANYLLKADNKAASLNEGISNIKFISDSMKILKGLEKKAAKIDNENLAKLTNLVGTDFNKLSSSNLSEASSLLSKASNTSLKQSDIEALNIKAKLNDLVLTKTKDLETSKDGILKQSFDPLAKSDDLALINKRLEELENELKTNDKGDLLTDLVEKARLTSLVNSLNERKTSLLDKKGLQTKINIPNILEVYKLNPNLIKDTLEGKDTYEALKLIEKGSNPLEVESLVRKEVNNLDEDIANTIDDKDLYDTKGLFSLGDEVDDVSLKGNLEPTKKALQNENELKGSLDKGSNIPKKTTLEKDLTQEEILDNLAKWDLETSNNKLIVSHVSQKELDVINQARQKEGLEPLVFKGNYAPAREVSAENIRHILNKHGDQSIEARRGQVAVTLKDIAGYQDIIKNPTEILMSGNRIIYAKQINGHYIVIEEVLTGQNKINLVTMWKGKGKVNKQVLLSHNRRPKRH
ncbi:hypothetical protein BKH43_07450 [Helicobacter sp. 13S00401-1]|uniref:putative barnase/colicin E5 family endoribonuclease n=1 Tax=Helicobacter sp. 13S00401-1 TaxID=1905758 RepID=UPI000BA5B964|nr:hypothetical protein [Helicobacter sp. 13S00401-1]PAF49020.1 hypothetical protein BKH43_07450 [Helicobacter sp. 13S00401-1]